MNPKFNSLLAKMQALHDRKNNDYASSGNPYSNFEFAARVSEIFTDPVDKVFATLIAVKMARIAELTGAGKTPSNESLQDSRVDLSNYATIWTSYYEENPNEQKVVDEWLTKAEKFANAKQLSFNFEAPQC